MKKFIFILIAVVVLFSSTAYGIDGEDVNNEQMSKINGLYDYISSIKSENEILKDISPKEFVQKFMSSGDETFGFKEFVRSSTGYIFKEVVVSFKLIGQLIIIAIVCSLLNNLQNAFSNEKLSNIAYFACFSVMIILIAKGFYIGVTLTQQAIKAITDFMAALMPVLIILLASIGNVSQALVMDPIIMGVCTIGSALYSTVIIPVICMSFVLDFVNNISKEYNISNLTNILKKGALWVQGLFLTIFVGIITIRGIAGSSFDIVASKTAKFAVDNFIPFVGKSLSDAFTTVASYTLLLKNSISLLGVIVLIALILLPIIKIFVMAFMYKLTAALLQPISDKRVTSIIDSAGGSLILLGSCVICVSIMFFIMVAIVAGTGKGFILM